nr:response regulator [uncultured Holophaga sp.]
MSPEAPVPPARILLADDDLLFRESTAELLRQQHYHVDTAADGLEALRHLQSGAYDFLISDVVMPGNQDLALLRRAAEASPDLSMVVVTGYPSVESARTSLELPVLAYLLKPIDMEELLRHLERGSVRLRVRRTLRHSRARMREWEQDLEQLDVDMGAFPGRGSAPEAAWTLSQALGHISGLVLDMKILTEHAVSKGDLPHTCPVRHCPRLDLYRHGVEEAIEVLERTKHAFKSKELGQLRERLQRLLVDPGVNPPSRP